MWVVWPHHEHHSSAGAMFGVVEPFLSEVMISSTLGIIVGAIFSISDSISGTPSVTSFSSFLAKTWPSQPASLGWEISVTTNFCVTSKTSRVLWVAFDITGFSASTGTFGRFCIIAANETQTLTLIKIQYSSFGCKSWLCWWLVRKEMDKKSVKKGGIGGWSTQTDSGEQGFSFEIPYPWALEPLLILSNAQKTVYSYTQ